MKTQPVYIFEPYESDVTVKIHNPLQAARLLKNGANLLSHYGESDVLTWVFNYEEIRHMLLMWKMHQLL